MKSEKNHCSFSDNLQHGEKTDRFVLYLLVHKPHTLGSYVKRR